MDGWMNVTLKERLYSYIGTYIHLDMIELHADFFFKWQDKYDHTPLISFHSSFLF